MPETVNAMYSVGRLPELAELAERLEDQLGWKPVYWITQPELEDAVKARFPEVFCHDFTLGNRAQGDPLKRNELEPVGHGDAAPSQLEWTQLLQTLSRHVLGKAITTEQQIAIITERLEYCTRVVSTLNIKRFILASTPHSLLDMCFYVAMRMLGGEMRMHHLTGFRGYQVILDESYSLPFALSGKANVDGRNLSAEGQQEMAALMDKDQDQTPWYVRQQDEKTQSQARLYRAAESLLEAGEIRPGTVSFDQPPLLPVPTPTPIPQAPRGWFGKRKSSVPEQPATPKRDVFARSFQPKHNDALRRAFIHRAEGFAAPPITWREYYTYRDWALIQKQAWRRRYDALSEAFDVEAATQTPFVFFALHYQPERTTMPEGGPFADQERALRMISDALPEGWSLLVKEHPSQFLWQTEGELGRDNTYHDRLAALPGVTLVPLDVTSEALIAHAQSVITITGTVGWEAALNGTPTITLARPWYAGDGIVLQAQDAQSLASALQAVKAGWRPDEAAIRAHLARIESIGTRCFVNPSHAPLYPELTAESNLEALSDLFINSERSAQAKT